MKLEKFLYSTILLGFFLILFTPLIIADKSLFPYISGKAFFFRVIVEVMFASWLVLILMQSKYRPRRSGLVIGAVLFAAVIFLADIFGVDAFKSIWSNFERMEGFVALIHFTAFFLVAVSIKDRKIWHKWLQLSVFVSILVSLYGISQFSGNLEVIRLDATFGNATYLAIYILFNLFITLFLFFDNLSKEDQHVKYLNFLYPVCFILQLTILYYTATRGAILGFLAGILVMAIVFLFEKQSKFIRRSSISFLAIIIVLPGGFFAIRNSDFVRESNVLNRFASISLDEATTKSRFIIWDMALEGFKERPVLGWGQENFSIVFNKNYNPRMYNQEQWFDRAHNVPLDWLIAGGLLGFILYLSLFVFAIIYIFKGKNSVVEKGVLFGLLAAYFFNNLFVFDNTVSYIYFFALLAYIQIRNPKEEGDVGNSLDGGLVSQIILPIVFVGLLFSMYFVNIKNISASREIIRAISLNPENLESNLLSFKKVLVYDGIARQEVREHLIKKSVEVNGLSVDSGIKEKFFELARNSIQDQIERVPNNARNHWFLAVLYKNVGLLAQSEESMKKAMELSPNKQTFLIELGLNYLSQERYDEASEIFEKSYQLETSYIEPFLLLSLTPVYAGDFELSDNLLQEKFNQPLVADTRFVEAYVLANKYERAVEFGKYVIEQKPDRIDHWVLLAQVHLYFDRPDLAEEVMTRAANFSPKFSETAQSFIQAIHQEYE
jgi:O-antigen ligase/Tfp pilus assembly protein PilF